MMHPLYFVTTNRGKFQDIARFIPDLIQIDVELPEVQDLNPQSVVEAKIREARKVAPDCHILVEDTSVHLDCLNGLPGPFIKWFIHRLGLDGFHALTQKYKNSSVLAKCTIGFSANTQDYQFFEGSLLGSLIAPPEGIVSGAWDEIFAPAGYSQSFAQLSFEVRKQLHPRYVAAEKLKKYLST